MQGAPDGFDRLITSLDSHIEELELIHSLESELTSTKAQLAEALNVIRTIRDTQLSQRVDGVFRNQGAQRTYAKCNDFLSALETKKVLAWVSRPSKKDRRADDK